MRRVRGRISSLIFASLLELVLCRDREGVAAAFLRDLAASGRTVVTVPRADQYAGLDSFADVGPFAPLCCDRHGAPMREAAPARFTLALPDGPAAMTVAAVRR